MNDTTVELSIVIVNWNASDVLDGCLESIGANASCPHEIIVVDNASSDDSCEMVKARHPGVRLIANDMNMGFAAANNQGIRIATGRYVLLLNPDTLIVDTVLDDMIAIADEHTECGVVGCQVRETPEVIQQTCFRFPTPGRLFLREFGLARLCPSLFGGDIIAGWDRCSERDVDVISGMFMLVRSDRIAEIGLLDERFFIYTEEADWCYRFHKAGYACRFFPGSWILHLDGGSKSTRQVKPKMYVQKQKSQLQFMAKHHGRAGWFMAWAILLISMIFRVLIHAIPALFHQPSVYRLDRSIKSLRFLLSNQIPA